MRCLDDIPMGTFVCTYAGQILNEDMANKVLLVFPCDYLSRSSLNLLPQVASRIQYRVNIIFESQDHQLE